MKLEEIGFYTLSNERAINSSIDTSLKRCELILTSTCNFNCTYCMPLIPEIRGTMSFDKATSIVNRWIDNNLESIRFSGGEPTLYKGLDELVSICKNIGKMKNIAISTNGSANLEYYKYLYACGVTDFSISLDSACCSVGDKMAGKTGSWEKVVSNIREISKFCYVTVGMVFTEQNIDDAINSILFAHSLGVSDIRIISAAQYNKGIANLTSLHKDILDAHPILNYRVQNYLNGRNVRGMNETDCNKCKLVLDDMIVAGNYHFPCVIYMRQQGKPIGTIDNKTIKEIRQERKEWFENTDTHKEEICKRTCLDVCVHFNNIAACKFTTLENCDMIIGGNEC